MDMVLSVKDMGANGRLNWDEYYMAIALLLGTGRSTCIHYKVGCVVSVGEQLLSFGYNGPVRGEPHCSEIGCAKEKNGVKLPPGSGLCRGSHAEINAIANAANLGVSIKDSTFSITYRPCYSCAKELVNAKVRRVVYYQEYDGEPQAIELLRRRRIELVRFDMISQVEMDLAFPVSLEKIKPEKEVS